MDGLGALLFVLAVVIIVWLWSRASSLDQELTRAKAELSRVSSQIQREAQALYNTWRTRDYDSVRKEQGSPVDFIVFDGLDDDDLGDVVFVEVKTGAGSLTRTSGS